ncbi:hypothetical protein Mal35_16880 [Gimesia maris]|uniref:hypothetical protein n=1 Tax=Gimesia maris TaxID=122 RepID=UPI00118BF6E4|nr:hypothetical protein [Gimesia maris]QDT78256.1 hypothetical protein Mal35_16880 [Gimesia maris]
MTRKLKSSRPHAGTFQHHGDDESPPDMMELGMLPLMVLLVHISLLGTSEVKLPWIVDDPKPTQQHVSVSAAYKVEVLGDGRVMCNGVETPLTDVAKYVASRVDKKQTIRLILETESDGTGPLVSLLQLQRDFSNAGLWRQTQLPHTRPPSSNIIERSTP